MPIPLEEFDPEEGIVAPAPIEVDGDFPAKAVLCFFAEAIEHLHARGQLDLIGRFSQELGGGRIFATRDRTVAVTHPGVGGPHSAHSFERLIASGVRAAIAVGGAGSLAEAFGLGDILVVESAVRDEGTSFHYLPSSRSVALDPQETSRVLAELRSLQLPARAGVTWTTDADFRETPARVDRRREEGCVAVEMEAASLAAVAQYRGVQYAHVLYSGDALHGATWSHRGWTSSERRVQLLEAGLTIVR
jgi:uridine phosphorylase